MFFALVFEKNKYRKLQRIFVFFISKDLVGRIFDSQNIFVRTLHIHESICL